MLSCMVALILELLNHTERGGRGITLDCLSIAIWGNNSKIVFLSSVQVAEQVKHEIGTEMLGPNRLYHFTARP